MDVQEELFFHGGNHALQVKRVRNSLIQVLTWAVPVRCAVGKGKPSRVMQWERRSMENLQRLCKMSCPSSLDAASGKEGKGRRRKRKKEGFGGFGELWLGQEPNHSHGWNKKESTEQNPGWKMSSDGKVWGERSSKEEACPSISCDSHNLFNSDRSCSLAAIAAAAAPSWQAVGINDYWHMLIGHSQTGQYRNTSRWCKAHFLGKTLQLVPANYLQEITGLLRCFKLQLEINSAAKKNNPIRRARIESFLQWYLTMPNMILAM